mmetsp:Transcript_13417/g.27709  ORF Transcript_13417/g.27709 Transcript_13417/m.27709 type:complete len:317 (-) Transcript_13417:428-1378(-)
MDQAQLFIQVRFRQVHLLHRNGPLPRGDDVPPKFVQFPLGPPGRPFQPVDHRLQQFPVRLPRVAHPPPNLVAAVRDGKLRRKLPRVGGEQTRRLGPIRQADLPRDVRGHVRIAVPVPPHPARELHGGAVEGERVLLPQGESERGVELAKERGQGLPEDRLDDEGAALGLGLGGGLDAGDFVGLPDGGDLAVEAVVEDAAAVGGGRAVGPLLVRQGEELLHPLVLVQQSPPIHLRRVGRQHQFHLLRTQRLPNLSPLHPHVVHHPLQHPPARVPLGPQRPDVFALGALRHRGPVEPAAVMGLRGVREGQEMREGPRD